MTKKNALKEISEAPVRDADPSDGGSDDVAGAAESELAESVLAADGRFPDAPADPATEASPAPRRRMSGYELADTLRQERREKRLLEKGY